MNIIAAVDKNWAIGKNNELLVRIPMDQKFFRETTTGKVVVMGRKTLESFPNAKPLKNRKNVVLTTDKNFKCDGTEIVHGIKTIVEKYGGDDTFVIGGGEVYKQLLPYCDSAYITKVFSDGNADVFIDMPNLRQYGGYTCGTTCVQMVMNWLDPYQADWNLAAYEEELGTNEEAGTPPGSIVSFFEENSVTVTAKENRTTPELASALYQGHPVLLCIQSWAAAEDGYNTQNSDDADTYLAEGHWVICVGYQKQEPGYVFYFNDPACVGYCMMSEQDLNNRWIDMDTEGNVYDHYGIEITADGTSYNPDGVFYLE